MSACTTDINAHIASQQSFIAWKATTSAALETTLTPAQLLTIQTDIFGTSNCLDEKVRNLSALSTTDSAVQLEIENLQQQIDAEKKNVEIAQQRLASLKHKETSFYESWFPMTRPLRPTSVPILLGISASICYIALSYLLRLMGIYIFIKGPTMSVSTGSFDLLSQFTTSFWIVLLALVVVVLYYTLRK